MSQPVQRNNVGKTAASLQTVITGVSDTVKMTLQTLHLVSSLPRQFVCTFAVRP